MTTKPGALFFLLLTVACPLHDQSLGTYKSKFAGRWVSGKHSTIHYRMFAPAKISKATSLPIVIYLHGSAKVGNDNVKQTKVAVPVSFVRHMKKRPCILIAPQCPPGTSWMTKSGDAVIELVDDILKQVSVADKKRVYLTGFSLGGMGTWRLLDLRPDLFAAAVPLAGAGNPATAGKLQGVDIWIFHGRRDKFVPVKYARDMAAALKKAGAPAKYSELVAGHLITSMVFNKEDVHQWLFQQKRE